MSNSKFDHGVKGPDGSPSTAKQSSSKNLEYRCLKKAAEEEDSSRNTPNITLLDHIVCREIPTLSKKQEWNATWQFIGLTHKKPEWRSSTGNYKVVQLDRRNDDKDSVTAAIFESKEDYTLYLKKCDSIEGMDKNLQEEYPEPRKHLCDRIYAQKICQIVSEFEELERKWRASGILGYYLNLATEYRDIKKKLEVDTDTPLKKKHKTTRN